MTAQVIQFTPKLTPCAFRSSCPIYQKGLDDDPVAAIYSIITRSGDILNGLHKVKEHQVEDLLAALERITIRLHAELAA